MKLYVLGTGAALISKYVNSACVFEENGELFLVDGTGGNDVLRCFERAGLPWERLHYAFLSHEHTDHLLGMVWAIRMIAEQMDLEQYEGNFYLYGHGEVLEKIETICRLVLKSKSQSHLGNRIFFMPVADREAREIWGHRFVFFDIQSNKARQFGFVMYCGDKKLVFAGDEPLKENGKRYAENADWLLAESFCLDADGERLHAHEFCHQTVKETAAMARALGVRNLMLWHTEDETFGSRKARYTEEAARWFGGPVTVPDDGEIIEI